MHFAEPLDDAYVPTGQRAQLVAPEENVNVPALQLAQVIAAVDERKRPNLPRGHSVHEPDVPTAYDPATQQVADPADEKVPI